ncbi:hypothetical protein [Streptomyces sp. NPDC057301]|uniref:hypothetical protein n=1 Tax=Streptomyces sp. NPDC057301 TaxID=3346093 RepID=UPI0036251259
MLQLSHHCGQILLVKHLAKVRSERAGLAVAERVLERVSEQLANERASVPPTPAVGGAVGT